MHQTAALRVAIDLLHVPSRVRGARLEPLPEGVVLLVEIASGDSDAMDRAVLACERPSRVIEDAATFFIEQILFHADSDSYRVLGVTADAPIGELRRNMALLLKWLHPDLDRDGGRSVYAARVTRAWEDLKTPQRRRDYDIARQVAASQGSLTTAASRNSAGTSKGGRKRRARRHPHYRVSGLRTGIRADDNQQPPNLLRRLVAFVLRRREY